MENIPIKYIEFNKKCFDYYIQHSDNFTPSFFIPPSIIQEWLGITITDSTPFEDFEHQDWIYFTENCTEFKIPRGYGLIALQCYAVFLMDSDIEAGISEGEYIKRLNILLRIKYASRKFGGGLLNNQDIIWKSAKKYLLDFQNIDIKIPKESKYAGRNVQYPKSQVFFRISDFNKLHNDLKNISQQQVYSFNEFKTKMYSSVSNLITKLHKKDKITEAQKDQFIGQLYNYYNTYKWYNKELIDNKYQRQFSAKEDDSQHNIIVQFNSNENVGRSNFNVFELNDSLDFKDCISYLTKLLNQNKLLLFKHDIYDEYIQEFKLRDNVPYLILINTIDHANYLAKEFNLYFAEVEDNFYAVYLKDGIYNKALKRYLELTLKQRYDWIELSGVRTNFSTLEFLEDQKITIAVNDNAIKIVNLFTLKNGIRSSKDEKLSFEVSDVIEKIITPGDYELVHKELKPIRFSVRSLPEYPSIEVNQKTSLLIDKMAFIHNKEGIYSLHFPISKIELSLGKHYKEIIIKNNHIQSSNTIIKALNKKYYGRN